MCPAPSEIESLGLELLEVVSYYGVLGIEPRFSTRAKHALYHWAMLLAQQVGFDEGNIFTVAAAGEKS